MIALNLLTSLNLIYQKLNLAYQVLKDLMTESLFQTLKKILLIVFQISKASKALEFQLIKSI